MRAVARGVEAGPVMVHRPVRDAYAGQTVSCSTERSTCDRSRSRRVLVCGPGSCLAVDRRRAQNGSGGGSMAGSGRDQGERDAGPGERGGRNEEEANAR